MSLSNYIRRTKGEDREDINRLLGVMSDIFYPEPEEGSVQERIVLGQERRIRTLVSFTGILDVQTAETRDKHVVEAPTLQMPTACESYALSDIVVSGTPAYEKTTDTQYGGGVILDGSTDFFTIANGVGDNLDLERTDAFSIAVRFKRADTAGSSEVIIAKRDEFGSSDVGFSVAISGTGEIVFDIADGTTEIQVRSTADQDDGAWHTVVCTYDGSSNETGMTIYIDGSSDATGSSGSVSSTIINTKDFTIGAMSDDTFKWTGSLAWIMIFNEELSSGWVTGYEGGFYDWSGGNLITCIPFVGDETVWAEATTPFCTSS